MTADLDTRWGELYPRGDEVLPGGGGDADRASEGGCGHGRSRGGCAATVGFSASREQFQSLVSFLDGTDAAGLSHAELEERGAMDFEDFYEARRPQRRKPDQLWCSRPTARGS